MQLIALMLKIALKIYKDMALTKKIVSKIKEKTSNTNIKPNDLIRVLDALEQGRQTKAILDQILTNI